MSVTRVRADPGIDPTGAALLTVRVFSRRQDHVFDRFVGDTLRLHQQVLDHGVGRLPAAGGYLDRDLAKIGESYLEFEAADVARRYGDRLRGNVQQLEVFPLFQFYEEFLRRVQVVVEGDLDRELLAPDRRIRQVYLQEERLEYPKLRLGDSKAVFLGQGNPSQHPGGYAIRRLHWDRRLAQVIRHHVGPQPCLREELAHS